MELSVSSGCTASILQPVFLLSPAIFPWDLAILILLSGTLASAIGFFAYLRRRRRNIVVRVFVSVFSVLSLTCFLLVAYGSFVEPHLIMVTRHRVPMRIEHPLRVVVISDIHVGPYKGAGFVKRLVQAANRQLPDLILLAGDFIYDSDSRLSDLAPLAELRSSLGTYAVLGNHDEGWFRSFIGDTKIETEGRGEDLASFLDARDIRVLRNEYDEVSSGDETIAVAGVNDLWAGDASLSGALMDIPRQFPVILLSHNPSIALTRDSRRADLIVSGHTHGGQIRLPGVGPLATLPTELGQQYDEGVFQIDETTLLAISRGAGETGARARLFAWPEVMVLELEPRM